MTKECSCRRVEALKPYRGPPMTLGNAATARVRFLVWCLTAGIEPSDPSVPDWHHWLVCSQCGSRRVDMDVTGDQR
jgi:hypothetical protein